MFIHGHARLLYFSFVPELAAVLGWTLWGWTMTPVKSFTILLATVICCGRMPVQRPSST